VPRRYSISSIGSERIPDGCLIRSFRLCARFGQEAGLHDNRSRRRM
jgi:hypothetical protein